LKKNANVAGQTFARLQGFKGDSVDLDAEVVLGYVLGRGREWIFANFQFSISNFQLSKYKRLINQRVKGVPVAYLTKHKSFYNLDFYVDKRVLIPRPETEMLVTEVLTLLRSMLRNKPLLRQGFGGQVRNKQINIVDVGTGSGCVAVAIAKKLNDEGEWQFAPTIYGVDISKDALAVARKNSRKHDAGVKFLHGDLLEPVIERGARPDTRPRTERAQASSGAWVIVANLPYLKPSQIKGDIKHEPREALEAGKDGLKYYERLLKQITTEGEDIYPHLQGVVVFEIDPGQTAGIKKLIKKYLPKGKVSIKKDLAGRDRVVIIN